MLKNKDLIQDSMDRIRNFFFEKKLSFSNIKIMSLKHWLINDVVDGEYDSKFKNPFRSTKASKNDMIQSMQSVMSDFSMEDLNHSKGVTRGAICDFDIYGVLDVATDKCLSTYLVHEKPLNKKQIDAVQLKLGVTLVEKDKNICELL